MRWLFGAALLSSLIRAAAPPLNIHLETGWPAPPLLLEILETAYDEDPSSYFPLLQLLTTHFGDGQTRSEQETLNTALDLITSHELLSGPSALSTFHLALGLHTSVPKVEALYGFYANSVDESKLRAEECESWVEWRGKGFCDVEGLRNDMERGIGDGSHHQEYNQTILPIDHISPSRGSSNSPKAILYIDLLSQTTLPLLDFLNQHASSQDFQYIVRYRPPRTAQDKKTALSGYGVELALKKTDYLVVDDRVSGGLPQTPIATKSTSANGSGIFSSVLGDELDATVGITKEELRGIGLQAASLIMSSPDPLEALLQLSQDFPRYSAALAQKVVITDAIQAKIPDLMRRGPSGPALYINGKAYEDAKLNAYSLVNAIREERHAILSLTSLGLTPRQAFELISDPMIGAAQTEDDPGEGVVDASDRPENGDVITWWNDIEKDKRYKQWPTYLQGYLRPLYPGQFHTVRRNTWNLVFILDLSLAPSLEVIAETISGMVQRGIPFHFGIVPMLSPQSEISTVMAKVFHYCVEHLGRGATKDMFAEIVAATVSSPANPGIVQEAAVRQAFTRAAGNSKKPILSFDEMLRDESHQEYLARSQQYAARLAATAEDSPAGHLFVNGKYIPMSGSWTAFAQQEIASQLSFLQEQIATGYDGEDVSTFFYDLPSTTSRRNKLIIPGPMDNKLAMFNLLDVFAADGTGKLRSESIYAGDEARGSPLTMYIIGDLDSREGHEAVKDALSHLQTPECASRLGFVHVPSGSHHGNSLFSTTLYTLLTQSSLSSTTPEKMAQQLEIAAERNGNADAHEQLVLDTSEQEKAAEFWKVGNSIAEGLKIRTSQPHILINGRLVGPISSLTFSTQDYEALEAYEHRKRIRPVIDLLKPMFNDITSFDRPTLANLISTASSVIGSAYAGTDAGGIFAPAQVSRGRYYEKLDDGALSFSRGDPETAILHIAAIFDPISEQAQTLSRLLKTLSEMENVSVQIYLDPEPLVTEMKLKRFYRYSLAPQLSFDVDGNTIAPIVTFDDLPTEPIFTLGLDTPPSWIVSPKTSPYDLDNLVFSNIREPVNVLFTLKQLLIEGHAREANNAPPRGLQLQLTQNGLEVASDTQVMANLGYLQFKATPGVYSLSIRPGRGTGVYELESVGNEGWNSRAVNETGTTVILSSFEGVTILPRFQRRLGMETANVLVEDIVPPEPDNLVGAVVSKWKEVLGLSSAIPTKPKTRHAEINIFTVASGLLYERFASIMILSVMKHTKSTVKFWFIENFLSPTFLAFLPHLAEEYGFQYETVTYKWPHWLRAQTEKQRIIWAYKILFLDVLFPMDLDKVIFVDADQIVRVDMKELVDVDLHGRVYGYAPMGNDRTEMEGFRFWKTGYWKEALRGRPYHISALYVVDLKRFRQLATGDRLRGQYHALSADPNSLANLDQDLPNSMQDQIPIFTLDRDWLWCQTWCSDESLATAKTIDLCQNPLTKEPKLVRARQIPEWDVYDREVAAVASRISGEGGGLAGSVDDLAGDKARTPVVASDEPESVEPAEAVVEDRHLEGEL